MSVIVGLAAVVAVGGALVAVTARDARVALGGLILALAATPFLADPLPAAAPLLARIVAALLGGYLLLVVLRDSTAATRGSLVGLPAETLAAAAGFVIGYGTNGLGSPPYGPPEASAAGFALAVLALAPIVRGADMFRLGIGLALLVTAGELVRVGLVGTPPALEQLTSAALTVGLLGAVAALSVHALAAAGRLTLDDEPRRGALHEAHPAPTPERLDVRAAARLARLARWTRRRPR